ncbi:MAG: hypothetical protein WCQ86_00245 [Bacteroidaceae bacterium]
MKYLIVDACLNGTGIRDEYSENGGFTSPESLGLSCSLIQKLNRWLSLYAQEFYDGYKNENVIKKLDDEGKAIAIEIKAELKDIKITYYSDAKLKKEIVF